MNFSVDIIDSGRGGSIHYNEGHDSVVFSWEFALRPVLALIFGPPAARWDTHYPWAAGRQREIFDRVAQNVLQRKANGCLARADSASGIIEIVEPSDASSRSSATHAMRAERIARARPDATSVRRDLQAELRDHLSFDVRLNAAEMIYQQDATFDIEEFVAGQIRDIFYARDGLESALRLAAAHPGERMLQALLYACWNHTECSQAFARLLLELKGVTPAPDDEAAAAMIEGLGYHTNYTTRRAAFTELCRRTAMEI
jgi:hypothetical protein